LKGYIFNYVLWRPKYQRPGTRKEQSVRSLFTSCYKQHSSVERALSLKPIGCFSGAAELLRLAAFYASNPQSNSLCLRRTLAALVVNVSKLPLTRLHETFALNPKNSRALTVLFNGAGWILKLLLPAIIIANGYFKKKYSVVKITGNGRR